MSKYVVIKGFTDLEDDSFRYKAGNFFPRDGQKVDEARIDVLATDDNKQKQPLIVEVVERERIDEEPEPEKEEPEPAKKTATKKKK